MSKILRLIVSRKETKNCFYLQDRACSVGHEPAKLFTFYWIIRDRPLLKPDGLWPAGVGSSWRQLEKRGVEKFEIGKVRHQVGKNNWSWKFTDQVWKFSTIQISINFWTAKTFSLKYFCLLIFQAPFSSLQLNIHFPYYFYWLKKAVWEFFKKIDY